MRGWWAETAELATRVARRRLLQIAAAAGVTLLAACDPAATDSAPPPLPPATLTPPLAAETAMPLPVAQPLELALSWPRRAQVALAEILERTSWRVSITPTSPAAIEQLTGAASGADLVSPADPASMAAAGRLQTLPRGTVMASGSSWHPEALASGNSGAEIVALPLALRARLFTFRTDLMDRPADLAEWRSAAAALVRHDDRDVRFAGIDLTPAMHDPRWLLFGDRDCGRGGCYSPAGVEFLRSLFVDPGIAFRRDHPRAEWPLNRWPLARRPAGSQIGHSCNGS